MRINSKAITIIIVLTFFFALQAEDNIRPGLNFLKSAAVPGWGQLSLQKTYGLGFLAVEAGFWTMNFYYNSESDNKAEASIKYATKYGNIDPAGDYSYQFYEDMRYYICSGFSDGGYNAHIAQIAIGLYPDDPAAQQEYIDAHAYDEEHYWSWETSNNKREYSVYRKRIEEYSDYLKVLGGAIAANHIISAFDALRLSNKLKRVRFGVDFNSENTPLLSCTYKF
ncbi:MAG: hypothetical protein K9N06_04685 [Candidatus Cloacimonetes bacterium]|nr:hypothetical protein [Candidatus Cloacimonadota bacterium]